MEAAVDRGLVRDADDLALFLAGRLRGNGPVVAAGAAAGCLLAGTAPVSWGQWDAALSARTPSAAAREASRAQGATLLRTARRVWPSAALDTLARLGRRTIRWCSEPAVQAQASRSAEPIVQAATAVAHQAVAQQDPALLPSTSTPLPEVLAELHAARR